MKLAYLVDRENKDTVEEREEKMVHEVEAGDVEYLRGVPVEKGEKELHEGNEQ